MEVMKRSCGAVLGGPWRVARGLDCNVEVGRGLRGVHSGSLGLWMKQLRDNSWWLGSYYWEGCWLVLSSLQATAKRRDGAIIPNGSRNVRKHVLCPVRTVQ
jgi:hypothetical protein